MSVWVRVGRMNDNDPEVTVSGRSLKNLGLDPRGFGGILFCFFLI